MRTSLFLNKIWNSRVPLCCKRSLENVAKCNKYSHMCRKPETQVLKSVTMRYSWRGERRPQSPVLSASLCSDSAHAQTGIPAAQSIATGSFGEPATLWQQWQKTRCISRGGKERNVLKLMCVLSGEGSFRSQDSCQGSRGGLQCRAGSAGWRAQPLTPRSILCWAPTELCHLTWTLTWNYNKPEKQ